MLLINNLASNFGPKILRNQSFCYNVVIIQTRKINLEKISNKRITRLESDIELDSNQFKSRLINRNPRNLEQLSLEKKPTGFWLDKSPSTYYWNRLVFEKNGRYLSAYVQHWSGKKILEASTKEPQLAKYFKSPNATQAATVLAMAIARRCLQSGYLCLKIDDQDTAENAAIKTKTFFETVEANGVVLNELPEIVPRSVADL